MADESGNSLAEGGEFGSADFWAHGVEEGWDGVAAALEAEVSDGKAIGGDGAEAVVDEVGFTASAGSLEHEDVGGVGGVDELLELGLFGFVVGDWLAHLEAQK